MHNGGRRRRYYHRPMQGFGMCPTPPPPDPPNPPPPDPPTPPHHHHHCDPHVQFELEQLRRRVEQLEREVDQGRDFSRLMLGVGIGAIVVIVFTNRGR